VGGERVWSRPFSETHAPPRACHLSRVFACSPKLCHRVYSLFLPLFISQGSGWVWLGYNKGTGKVEVATCANQDPLSITGLVPLLGIDVWEHAYYLQYK
jgi:hypothetical protein